MGCQQPKKSRISWEIRSTNNQQPTKEPFKVKNKLRGKRITHWGPPKRWSRRLTMPEFTSTCASGHAADAAASRCNMFHWLKRINKIPRAHMKGGVLEQLLGGSHTQHITNN